MIYKSFDFQLKDIREDTDNNLSFVSGLISTFGNTDRDGDTILKGAFSKSLKDYKSRKKTIPILLSHDKSLQLGGVPPTQLKETDEGLEMTDGALDMNLERSRDTTSLLKNKFAHSFSFGFRANVKQVELKDDGGLLFKEVELFEISIVPVPADKEAVVTNLKELKDALNLKSLKEKVTLEKSNVSLEYNKELLKSIEATVKIVEDINQSLKRGTINE